MPVYTENGMPKSMCAACKSPVNNPSRRAAQDDCFTTSTFSPYCLNRPSSCAITQLAQSVRAMKPILIFSSLVALRIGVAAALEVLVAVGGAVALTFGASSSPPQAANSAGLAAIAPDTPSALMKDLLRMGTCLRVEWALKLNGLQEMVMTVSGVTSAGDGGWPMNGGSATVCWKRSRTSASTSTGRSRQCTPSSTFFARRASRPSLPPT